MTTTTITTENFNLHGISVDVRLPDRYNCTYNVIRMVDAWVKADDPLLTKLVAIKVSDDFAQFVFKPTVSMSEYAYQHNRAWNAWAARRNVVPVCGRLTCEGCDDCDPVDDEEIEGPAAGMLNFGDDMGVA